VASAWGTNASAEDSPAALNRLKQQTPSERWERVKAQSSTPNATVTTPKPVARPATAQALPEDDIAIVPMEVKLAPALPTSSDEPDWIRPARPIPAPEALVPTPDPVEAVVTPIQATSPTEPAPIIARSVTPTPAAVPRVAQVQEVPINSPAARPLAPRRLRTIQEISPYYDTTVDKDIRDFAVKMAGDYEVAFGNKTYEPRAFPDTMYAWEPSNFYHYPLYFEDAVLERYGHTYHPVVQPAVSVAKFGAQLVMLPYQMTLDPIDCPKYSLGWYRPGDCAPKLRYQPPLNAKAAVVEAGVVSGLFFIIP